MITKKIQFSLILFLITFLSFSQTPEHLLRGTDNSKNISSKPIFSENRKIKIQEKNQKSEPVIFNKNSPSSQVGTTPADFSVSLSGAATYNIPIATPPGVRDISPSVGLNFNSQSQGGLAGWGWGISGLSTISKVSATKFHDGFVDGVDFDSNDRFSLDGQRLILKSGTYGAHNSTYQTDTYSNIKIKAYGISYSPNGDLYGPASFIVIYPDGSRVWYGNSGNSKTRLEWAIYRKVDPQGNIIQYDYINDGELKVIDKIRFGHRVGTAPVEIKFHYKNRKRPEVGYVQGTAFKRSKILDRIETRSNGQLYRKYLLTHDETSLGYQRLISVKEYNKANQGLTPIIFSYQNATSNDDSFSDYSGSIYPGYNYQTDNILPGEFNGDGRSDFILYNRNTKNKIHIFNNIFDSSFNNIEIGRTYNVPNFDKIISNDMLNHQGKKLAQQGITLIKENLNGNNSSVDFKSYYNAPSNLYYHYTKSWSAPTYSYYNSLTSVTAKKIPKEYISGDFNGDGLTDVLAIGKPYTQRYCREIECPTGGGGGFDPIDDFEPRQQKDEEDDDFTKRQIQYQEGTYKRPPILTGPNDDTCIECNAYTVGNKSVHFIDLNRNVTSNFVNSAGNLQRTIKSNDRILTADFNGDGKTDLFHFTEGGLFVYELNSNSQLSLIHTEIDSYIKMNRPIVLGDYNGDGKTDFLVPRVGDINNNWMLFISKGNGILKAPIRIALMHYADSAVFPNWNYANGPVTDVIREYKYSALDVNGDGKSDLIEHNINSAYSSIHPYSEERFEIHTNVFNENDNVPSFERTLVFTKENTGITKYGLPILLNSKSKTDKLEYAYISTNNIAAYEYHGDHRADVTLEQINNNGTTHIINYAGLTNQENDYEQVYSGNYDEIYPYVNINNVSSLKLVNKVTENSGGLTRTQNFKYSGAVSHVNGLGLLGFKQVIKSNIHGYGVQRLWNITDFDVQKRGAIKRNWTSLNPSPTPYSFINKNDYTYQTSLTSDNVFINLQTQVTSEDALTGINRSTTYSYDSYYNPTNVVTSFPGGSKTVVSQYINNPNPFNSTYYIGRLSEQTTTNVLNGDTFSSSEKYIYNNNLITELRRKGNGTPWLYEYYQYDNYGNVLQKRISGTGISDRIESFQFDNSGRFMTKSIDNEGLETVYSYNIATGNPITITSAYGLPITYQYDDWGRVKKETNYLGKHTLMSYANSGSYMVKTTNYDQGEDEKIYYNSLGWVVKEGILSINNRWIFKDYEYDVSGKKLKESEPYFITSSPTQWNEYSFDQYGRPINQQLFTGKIVNTTYNGLTATVDDGTKTISSTKDALGNIVSIQDDGGTISYTYYANGEMKSTNYGVHSINITIDGWGRKIALNDPSAGNYTYQYNILGEILQETTPKGVTNYQYNALGKLINKEVIGDETNMVTNYQYDASSKLLTSMDAINGITGSQYQYNYFYDSSKRINKITENNGTANFEKQLIYDGYGRVNKEVYITNNNATGVNSVVSVKNIYDASGTLREIRDFNSNNLLWRINNENARGKALSINLGNGIIKTKQYDEYGFLTKIYDRKLGFGPIGSTPPPPIVALKMDYDFNVEQGLLNSRKNYAFTNWNEGFTYDNLNRLTQVTGPVEHQKEYDQRGRITNNSNIGTYNYNSSNTYRLENVNLNNQGDLYYQQNKLQGVTYNAFKKPIKISQEDRGKIDFEYGPFMNRTHAYYGGLQDNKNLRQYHKQYSSIIPVEIIDDNIIGSTKIITYVGGDGYTAPIAFIKEDGTNDNDIDEYHYLHRDYLGSILAISNSSAEIVEQRQFGAWGETDKFINISGETNFSHNSIIGRGFTGHEHFFEVSLIHMNGRMYDAKLGRFLSPDNFIQDPYNTQSFNRYGYVWNNPLSYNDTTGEVAWAAVLVGVVVGAIAGAAAYVGHAVKTGNWNWGSFGLSILGGAIVGGISYGIAPSLVWTTGSALSIAASGFVGAFLPSYNIPIGDWNISISPSIAFGNASGVGASLGVGYSDGDWSFSGGIGYMNYGNYNGFGNGTEIRYSIFAAYDDGKTGFSLGTNWWRGDYQQRTGLIGFRNGDFKLRYENDGGIGIKHLRLGDRGDSYRTASLQLSVGDYSAGFRLFTGYRGRDNQEREGKVLNAKGKEVNPTYNPELKGEFGRKFRHGYVNETGPRHRLGALTFGYKGFRIGTNSEHVRHAIQNRFIHNAIGDRGFRNTSWDWKGMFQYRTPNSFTSW